jgi:methionyl-tRNA synthetase
VPAERLAGDPDGELQAMLQALRARYEAQMEKFQFQNALDEVFKCIQRANKYIDETAPWALAKDDANKPRLAGVMYNLLEAIRICTVLLRRSSPPPARRSSRRSARRTAVTTWDAAAVGACCPRRRNHKGEAVFPRIDMEKALAELTEREAEARKAALPALETEPLAEEQVDFDTFCKLGFPRRQGQELRGGQKVRQAAALHARRRHRHRPPDPLRHPQVL